MEEDPAARLFGGRSWGAALHLNLRHVHWRPHLAAPCSAWGRQPVQPTPQQRPPCSLLPCDWSKWTRSCTLGTPGQQRRWVRAVLLPAGSPHAGHTACAALALPARGVPEWQARPGKAWARRAAARGGCRGRLRRAGAKGTALSTSSEHSLHVTANAHPGGAQRLTGAAVEAWRAGGRDSLAGRPCQVAGPAPQLLGAAVATQRRAVLLTPCAQVARCQVARPP